MTSSAPFQELPCTLGAAFSISETVHFVEMSFSSLIYSLYGEFVGMYYPV